MKKCGFVLALICAGLAGWVFGVNAFIFAFAFFNLGILASMNKNALRYGLLKLPKISCPAFNYWFFLLNQLLVFFAGYLLVLATKAETFFPQGLFSIVAATLFSITILWYIVASKLTPKSMTMAVDEKTDLYYLHGDELPADVSRMKIITPETKIPVRVLCSLDEVEITATFSFARWVFDPESRKYLANMRYYLPLFAQAEKEYATLYPDVNTIQDIWKLFSFRSKKGNRSPYVWDKTPVVS